MKLEVAPDPDRGADPHRGVKVFADYGAGDVRAEAHVVAWFARVDRTLVPNLEQLLGFASAVHGPPSAPSPPASPRAAAASAPASAPEPRSPQRKAVKR